jgi:molecular chaperone DnaK
VEDIITLPLAIAEARQMIEWTEKVVEAVASPEQKKRFGLLRQELMAALNNPNAEVLRRRTDEMNDLRLTLAQSQVEWWTGFFQYVEGNREIVSDAVIADRLFAQGRRAMNSNNLDELKSACFQLAKLLPGEQDDLFRNYEGTTIKT